MLKYLGEQDQTGRGQVHYGRVDIDGIPFRGDNPPLMRDEEFEELTEPVSDFYCELFDLTDDAQRKRYIHVMDRICNGVSSLIYIDRAMDKETGKRMAWVEWADRRMEISARNARHYR